MSEKTEWDWEIGEKRIPIPIKRLLRREAYPPQTELHHEWEHRTHGWHQQFGWVEEPYASPDGEQVAAIVNLATGSFGVWVNGDVWKETFDKAWHLRFTPDGRLTALVSRDEQWTMAVDDQLWTHRFDFVWQPQFNTNGTRISVAFQQDMQYGMAVDDVPWEQRFANISGMALSPDGDRSAAVVQIERLNEGEIFKFEKGVYTAAVNGKAWDRPFMNVWGGKFSDSGRHLAAQVRLNRTDYTIVVDGNPWDSIFGSVWEPVFNPVTHSVMAPVRMQDGWTMAEDGRAIWRQRFTQLAPESQGIFNRCCLQSGWGAPGGLCKRQRSLDHCCR